MEDLTKDQIKNLILQGGAPENLHFKGSLNLSGNKDLTELPPGLTVNNLDLSGCTALRELPAGLNVKFRLDLGGCTHLKTLPAGLTVGSLDLSGCTGLHTLPEGLDVSFLDISDCTGITAWPEQGSVEFGRLNACRCTQICFLPPWLTTLSQLDVQGCTNLDELPDDLHVISSLELADTALTKLPSSTQGVQIYWRGVPIDERIAFHPETITANEILTESNIELRRVKLERMGYGNFLADAEAEVLDADEDPGGPRRLLRIPLEDDEPLVCISVLCPSTGRQYIIRVPPAMQSCHQAAAWIAGFDNPDDYVPIAET